MPPFNTSDLYSAQNTTGDGSVPANATNPDADSAQQVSWQSAYWPVMACMLAVLLQETGRVIDAPFSISYALRACPVVCIFDTSMMLLKFMVMLAVGCSPRTAVRHVWYDRFDQDDHYSIDYEAPNRGIMDFQKFLWNLVFKHDRGDPPISEAADGTIELASSANPHGDSHSEYYEHMCSGALPAVDNIEPVGIDVPSTSLRTPDASSISRPQRSATLSSTDVAEVEFIVTEGLERQDEMTSTALPSDSPNTLSEQSQTTVDNTVIIAASQPLPNAFMVTTSYMDPPPGSTVDRGWRLSMISFICGAFPQAIKVFAMRGVPFTQVFVGIYLVSFVVPEIFRSLAGPVGQFNLFPLPIVLSAKSILSNPSVLGLAGIFAVIYVLSQCLKAGPDLVSLGKFVSLVPVGIMLAFPVTLLVLGVLRYLISLQIFANCSNGITSNVYASKIIQYLRTNLVAIIAGSFALSSSTVEPCLSLVGLYPTCLAGTLWTLWRISIFAYESTGVGFLIVLVQALNFPLFVLLIPYITYRFLFMGYYSNITRQLCGTKGTTEEFWKGMFILINFAIFTANYTDYADPWISSETFKPRWVEVLG